MKKFLKFLLYALLGLTVLGYAFHIFDKMVTRQIFTNMFSTMTHSKSQKK